MTTWTGITPTSTAWSPAGDFVSTTTIDSGATTADSGNTAVDGMAVMTTWTRVT